MNKRNFLIILSLLTAFSVTACLTINFPSLSRVRGSGNVITETRTVSGFDRVALSGIGELTITQGSQESLEIEAEDNLVEHITTEVKGDTLYIGFENVTGGISPTEPVLMRLTVKSLTAIEASGAGNIIVDGLETDAFDIEVSGAGSVEVKYLEADSLAVQISGAGSCEVAGNVQKQKVEISGAGSYNAGELKSVTLDAGLSGAGNATVWVTETLDATISGVGSLEYYGSPSVTVDTSGTGRVKSLGEK